jgi:hypothetical protein
MQLQKLRETYQKAVLKDIVIKEKKKEALKSYNEFEL